MELVELEMNLTICYNEFHLYFSRFDRFVNFSLRGKEQLPALLRAAGKQDACEHPVPLQGRLQVH